MNQPATEKINAHTKLCAVFGFPVRHSASPDFQNEGFRALNLNWRYVACEVEPNTLRSAIEGAKALGFVGVNLTVPHKMLAMDMVDVLDESAKKWGAVNTISFQSKNSHGIWESRGISNATGKEVRVCGFNTDADAILRSITEDLELDLSGKSVLVLGAGGAGRVAVLKLAEAKVSRLYLVNRTQSKIVELEAEIKRDFPGVMVEKGYPANKIDLVLNATSLGLKAEDTLPFDPDRFDLQKAGSAYDMIYNPGETPFLKMARSHGLKAANGVGMLLYQGAKAFEIWTGRPAPLAEMRKALLARIYGTDTLS
ncbi:MAG: Shikimate dehydrogenase [Verrucomicrobiales bacterium]|nr:Shikimate dehydrogenase [Verrucomicrobiales bacterium]